MNDLKCSQHSVTYQISNPNCRYEVQDELDSMITNLKAEIFEKQQSAKDYCALEAKINKLQNEICFISDQKICLEHEIAKSNNDGNALIANLRAENENLMSDLNEKNILNKKLYYINIQFLK